MPAFARFAWVLFLVGITSCDPDLTLPPRTVPVGDSKVHVRVWVTRTDGAIATVQVRGITDSTVQALLPPPSHKDTGSPVQRPESVDLDVPESMPLLFAGAWKFEITVSSLGSATPPWTTTCSLDLKKNETAELAAYEPTEGCAAPTDFGSFPFDHLHDVAVNHMDVEPSVPPAGSKPKIRVSLENRGTGGQTETVNVEAAISTVPLGTSPPIIIPANDFREATFDWDTALLMPGPYTAEAKIPALPGETGTDPKTGRPFDQTDNNKGRLPVTLGPPDADNDRKSDPDDNCPSNFNPGQEDIDGDGKGDVCDNCRFVYNPGQADADASGKGDACDLKIYGFYPPCGASTGQCDRATSTDCTLPTAPSTQVARCVFLFGEGFDATAGGTQVSVGGQVVPSNTCETTRLVFTGPLPATGANAPLTVQVGAKLATSPTNYCPTVPPCSGPPSALMFSPIGGAAGTTVYILGCGFTNPPFSVTIGDNKDTAGLPIVMTATRVLNSSELLQFVVRSNVTLSGRITVTAGGVPLPPMPRVFVVLQ